MPRMRMWLDSLGAYLEDRIGFDGLRKLAKKKDVPVHRHTIWYYLGGMTLFLFVVQIVTGILLLFYYLSSSSSDILLHIRAATISITTV